MSGMSRDESKRAALRELERASAHAVLNPNTAHALAQVAHGYLELAKMVRTTDDPALEREAESMLTEEG